MSWVPRTGCGVGMFADLSLLMPAASNGFSSKRKGLSRQRCWTFAPFPGRKAAMKKAPFVAAALATSPLALTPTPANPPPGHRAPGPRVAPHGHGRDPCKGRSVQDVTYTGFTVHVKK